MPQPDNSLTAAAEVTGREGAMSGRGGSASGGAGGGGLGGLGGGVSRLGGSGFWALAAGYLFAYFNAKSIEERKARIERVNKQLKNFYGPLLATITASRSAFRAMVRQHSPDGTKEAFQAAVFAAPDGPEARAYRVWMAEVLQPLNERAAKVVTEHIDLLDAPGLEPALLQLVAATSAYRVILQSWKNGDFSAYSVIKYPDHLADSLTREFNIIKRRQAALLGEGSRRAKAAHIHTLTHSPPAPGPGPSHQQPAGPDGAGAATAASGATSKSGSGSGSGSGIQAAAGTGAVGGGEGGGGVAAGSARSGQLAGVAAGGSVGPPAVPAVGNGRGGGGGGGGSGGGRGAGTAAAVVPELQYQVQPRSQLRSRL
ncbi:hypothetical protein CHLRE_09g411300v5 [Chlamydomonas reinhardtii]|uniref:Uncharacterized protein n=1 Tax=Chlamydomonas reinhardtii TaxID=3055 RepID=A0A2K3DFL2_CHLRE|nr:uncharacterized protein CHLRE_09g411300v5 [Chlamydomonas reinhardtii]PNW79331.1 hypothetical protein CHLRE_09g411300v5 [Chlamydomonas reinhardtii]